MVKQNINVNYCDNFVFCHDVFAFPTYMWLGIHMTLKQAWSMLDTYQLKNCYLQVSLQTASVSINKTTSSRFLFSKGHLAGPSLGPAKPEPTRQQKESQRGLRFSSSLLKNAVCRNFCRLGKSRNMPDTYYVSFRSRLMNWFWRVLIFFLPCK